MWRIEIQGYTMYTCIPLHTTHYKVLFLPKIQQRLLGRCCCCRCGCGWGGETQTTHRPYQVVILLGILRAGEWCRRRARPNVAILELPAQLLTLNGGQEQEQLQLILVDQLVRVKLLQLLANQLAERCCGSRTRNRNRNRSRNGG